MSAVRGKKKSRPADSEKAGSNGTRQKKKTKRSKKDAGAGRKKGRRSILGWC